MKNGSIKIGFDGIKCRHDGFRSALPILPNIPSTRVGDNLGYHRDFYYDENGRMTRLTEADGGIVLFENQGDAIHSMT